MTEDILFDDFKKTDLRTAKIISAERIIGSEKLLKISAEIGGGETRQILAGIGKKYEPETLQGKSVIIVANLTTRMMMGEKSEGMLLAAGGGEEGPVLIIPEKEVPPGTKIS